MLFGKFINAWLIAFQHWIFKVFVIFCLTEMVKKVLHLAVLVDIIQIEKKYRHFLFLLKNLISSRNSWNLLTVMIGFVDYVNVVSHVGWSFLLLGSKERECVLCHVDWSVLLERPAWKREKVCSVMLTGLSCLKGLRGRERERERENVLSRVDWSVLAASKEEAKREFVLYHVGWVCPAAGQWGSEKRAAF